MGLDKIHLRSSDRIIRGGPGPIAQGPGYYAEAHMFMGSPYPSLALRDVLALIQMHVQEVRLSEIRVESSFRN